MKKKILFLMESLRGGGAEKVFIDLLESFDTQRYDLNLILVFNEGVHLHKVPKHIPARAVYRKRPGIMRRIMEHRPEMRNKLYRRDIRRLTEGEHYECIISFMEGPTLKMHSHILDLAPRHITWCHIDLRNGRWTSYLYRHLEEERAEFSAMSEIVFVSQGAKEAFEEIMDIHDRLHVVYNIIPTEKIRSQAEERCDVSRRKFTFVNIGRMEPQKRQNRLIEAAAILRSRGYDFDLWIMGTGTLEEDLRKQISAEGLQDTVALLGFRSNPYPILKEADAFVLSSDAEGYPTVVCEALTLGKPVVATLIPGVGEQIGDGTGITTGLSAKELADGMARLIATPGLKEKLSAKALAKSDTFRKESILESIYALIDGQSQKREARK